MSRFFLVEVDEDDAVDTQEIEDVLVGEGVAVLSVVEQDEA